MEVCNFDLYSLVTHCRVNSQWYYWGGGGVGLGTMIHDIDYLKRPASIFYITELTLTGSASVLEYQRVSHGNLTLFIHLFICSLKKHSIQMLRSVTFSINTDEPDLVPRRCVPIYFCYYLLAKSWELGISIFQNHVWDIWWYHVECSSICDSVYCANQRQSPSSVIGPSWWAFHRGDRWQWGAALQWSDTDWWRPRRSVQPHWGTCKGIV